MKRFLVVCLLLAACGPTDCAPSTAQVDWALRDWRETCHMYQSELSEFAVSSSSGEVRYYVCRAPNTLPAQIK